MTWGCFSGQEPHFTPLIQAATPEELIKSSTTELLLPLLAYFFPPSWNELKASHSSSLLSVRILSLSSLPSPLTLLLPSLAPSRKSANYFLNAPSVILP